MKKNLLRQLSGKSFPPNGSFQYFTVFFGDSRYLVGIGIYFGKPKKKETFIYNSS